MPLYQQQELPPRRAGQAKPSYGLADQSGQRQLGRTVAGIGEAVWSQLLNAKIANEKALFLGAEKTAREKLNQYIIDHPFANEADIKAAQGRMVAEIEAAGKSSRLPDVQNYAKNWMAENREALMVKSGNAITEIIKQREQKNFNAQMEAYENSTDPDDTQKGVALIDNHTGSLIDPKIAPLMKEGFEQHKAAQFEKLRREQFKAGIEAQAFQLAAASGYDAASKMLSDPETVAGLIEAGMKREDVKSLLTDIDARLGQQEAADKVELDNAIEDEKQEIDNIFILPKKEFLDNVPAMLDSINNSTVLDVKEKEGQRAKINKRVEAIKAGSVDPIDQFDSKAYDDLSVRISRNSKQVKGTDISGRVGVGKRGGITVSQAEELTRLKNFYDGADALGNSLHRTYTMAITGLKTAKRFSRNETENIQLAAQARNLLDAWAVKNPDATEEDYQNFFDRLVDTSGLTRWERFWAGRNPAEERLATQKNIAEIQKELTSKPRKYKKGDKRTVGGVTYTYDGKVWND